MLTNTELSILTFGTVFGVGFNHATFLRGMYFVKQRRFLNANSHKRGGELTFGRRRRPSRCEPSVTECYMFKQSSDSPSSSSSLLGSDGFASSLLLLLVLRFLFPPNASSSVDWTGGSPVVPKNLPEGMHQIMRRRHRKEQLTKCLLSTHGHECEGSSMVSWW